MGELGPCRDQPRIGVERETVVRGIIEQVINKIYSDLDDDLKNLWATLEIGLAELRSERSTVIDLPHRRAN